MPVLTVTRATVAVRAKALPRALAAAELELPTETAEARAKRLKFAEEMLKSERRDPEPERQTGHDVVMARARASFDIKTHLEHRRATQEKAGSKQPESEQEKVWLRLMEYLFAQEKLGVDGAYPLVCPRRPVDKPKMRRYEKLGCRLAADTDFAAAVVGWPEAFGEAPLLMAEGLADKDGRSSACIIDAAKRWVKKERIYRQPTRRACFYEWADGMFEWEQEAAAVVHVTTEKKRKCPGVPAGQADPMIGVRADRVPLVSTMRITGDAGLDGDEGKETKEEAVHKKQRTAREEGQEGALTHREEEYDMRNGDHCCFSLPCPAVMSVVTGALVTQPLDEAKDKKAREDGWLALWKPALDVYAGLFTQLATAFDGCDASPHCGEFMRGAFSALLRSGNETPDGVVQRSGRRCGHRTRGRG